MSEKVSCKYCNWQLESNEVIWCRDDTGRIALCESCWEIYMAHQKEEPKNSLSSDTKLLMQNNPINVRSCKPITTLFCPNCDKKITSESIDKEKLDFEPFCHDSSFVKCQDCKQIYRIDRLHLHSAGIL